jgi:hypothetical protein
MRFDKVRKELNEYYERNDICGIYELAGKLLEELAIKVNDSNNYRVEINTNGISWALFDVGTKKRCIERASKTVHRSRVVFNGEVVWRMNEKG